MLLLYPGCSIKRSYGHRHLHSTMLLLYPRAYQMRTGDYLIYIPLCFYFIRQWFGHPRVRYPNLHSTMLLLYPPNLTVRYLRACQFTFHYASTLSKTNHPDALHLTDLHSTMLLLYPAPRAGKASARPIYIPLCFYFIRSKTAVGKSYSVNLHSTMLLLYRYSTRPKHSSYLHLHSTMLLLYPSLFFSKYNR